MIITHGLERGDLSDIMGVSYKKLEKFMRMYGHRINGARGRWVVPERTYNHLEETGVIAEWQSDRRCRKGARTDAKA